MTHEYHTPVLVDAVLQFLQAEREGIYVDGTLGGAGHAESLLRMTSPKSRLIGFDVDPDALSYAEQRLHEFSNRVTLVNDNFSNLASQLNVHSPEQVDGILLDLGVSSHHLNEAGRGFSFQNESRLDMRMNQGQTIDGWTVVNRFDEDRLAGMLKDFGEEKHAKRIAKKIVEMRKRKPVDTTRELSDIIGSAVGRRFLQKSLARVFQAIRIEVNRELENLSAVLPQALECLRVGGRMVVISYHSLEDRIVKDFFVEESSAVTRSGHKLLPDIPRRRRLEVLTRRPLTATDEEVISNPRARSAKLRAAEKLAP
jgi:16S rRNA (cytosine1402-N4)-methyltransferase